MEASDQTYDPGTQTVEEVVAHLEANPDQVEAVKALEAQGQNRQGIAKFSASSKDTVTVRVAYPHDEFVSNVKGVPTITRSGTEIDRSKVKAVEAAAERADARVEEVTGA